MPPRRARNSPYIQLSMPELILHSLAGSHRCHSDVILFMKFAAAAPSSGIVVLVYIYSVIHGRSHWDVAAISTVHIFPYTDTMYTDREQISSDLVEKERAGVEPLCARQDEDQPCREASLLRFQPWN